MKTNLIAWPCELSEPVKHALLSGAKKSALKPDEHFFAGKDGDNSLCCITRGLVVLSILEMPKSSPWVLFKPGDWFGGSLIDDSSFLFRARASCIDHAEIVSFSESLLKDLAAAHNEIYKLLYMVNRTRANEMTQMLFACTGLTLSQRVAFFLLTISKKFPHVVGAKPRISISQTTLAHALGLSRPKLNQQLHLLEQKKIIAIERMNIHILDVPPLEAMIARS